MGSPLARWHAQARLPWPEPEIGVFMESQTLVERTQRVENRPAHDHGPEIGVNERKIDFCRGDLRLIRVEERNLSYESLHNIDFRPDLKAAHLYRQLLIGPHIIRI